MHTFLLEINYPYLAPFDAEITFGARLAPPIINAPISACEKVEQGNHEALTKMKVVQTPTPSAGKCMLKPNSNNCRKSSVWTIFLYNLFLLL